MSFSDSEILKEVRDEFDYYVNTWAPIREEAKKDMRYVAGDPWDPQEKRVRKDAERPTLALDELSQFVNQLLNDPKQNPRTIKINPKGSGASDQTANTREGLVREILYHSRAQAAFTTGFQGAVQRSYGAWRVGSRFRLDGNDIRDVNDQSDLAKYLEQELYIGRIPNPDSVLCHPNYKELDASDAMGCFVLDRIRKKDFKRKYPKAKITDFTSDFIRLAPQWLQDNEVQVCEYWKIDIEQRKLFLIENKKNEPVALWEDELPEKFDRSRIKRERNVESRTVTQYETNGVEILGEPVTIQIPCIPIIQCFGEELWVDEGGGSKRMLFSLIRRARDPYMYYCYIRSCQAEVVGMTPKTPYIGAVGQFKTHEDQWQLANKQPYAFLQYDMIMDSAGRPLPAPQRQPYEPAVQGLEILAEGARRAIQAAMGITPLPTAAQRQNEKSGVALNAINAQEDRGSFGFIDNYNISLEHTGRVLDSWIPIVYDVPMDIGIRQADETHETIRINDPDYEEPNENGVPVKTHYDTVTGEHGVEVSTGPNFDDQRDEVDSFLNILVTNIEALPLAPDQKAKLLALAVKLKNIGPLGDEMAEIIAPSGADAQRQQQLAMGQQQVQQQQEVITQLQTELQKLQLEKAGKMVQGETQKQLQQMENDVKVLIALVEAKNQNAAQEMEMYKQFWIENHGAAHEVAMQAVQHAHDAQQAQAAVQATAQQSAQDQATAQQSAQDQAQQVSQPEATKSGQ